MRSLLLIGVPSCRGGDGVIVHSRLVGDRHESLIDRANEGERSFRNRQAVSLKSETRLARIRKENCSTYKKK